MSAKASNILDALSFEELHTTAAEHYIAIAGTIALEQTLRADDQDTLAALEKLRGELAAIGLPALSAAERGDTSSATRAALSTFILVARQCAATLSNLLFEYIARVGASGTIESQAEYFPQ